MCSSEPVFSDKSAAEAKASSASLEPSVARRILVGKMLIGSPHIFGSSHLVGMMSVGEPCCFRNPYSPKCVEDEFSEVRGSNLRWHGLGPMPIGVRGSHFLALDLVLMLRLLQESDTSCCDLLRRNFPRISRKSST